MATQDLSKWKTVNLQWPADSTPVPVEQVMHPTRESQSEQEMIARMWVMCAIEMQEKLRNATCTKPHFEKYRTWLVSEYERFKQPDYPQVPDSRELVALSDEDRLVAIQQMRERAKGTYMWPVIEGPWRVYDNVIDIVEGRVKLVKVLLKDGLLEKFYDWANGLSEVRPVFELMGRANPGLRILEIGAGTGGTTARAFEGLKPDNGERLYSSYVFTDISPLFFDSAKRRFEAYDNIEFRALDISKDPVEQGFEAGAYDLVIASNVLHATPCLVETLKNVRKLLQPKGFLFNQELSPPGKYVDFMVGLLPGWWLGEADGRAGGPCIPPAEWDRRLQQAGFEGLHAVGLDSEPPFYYNANMLSRVASSS
ncbi:class I SAM-dependent methyltransferase [Aspergillus undulatus]|uniref:class I SAM-dependent methyltransferase n=1 Tax=Aspergillus undulatus TaxID=1810928 RepID=UPI003CCD878D